MCPRRQRGKAEYGRHPPRPQPGETLRLIVQGRDIHRAPRPLVQPLHDDSLNRGPHVIHTGGSFDSYLLVPRIG